MNILFPAVVSGFVQCTEIRGAVKTKRSGTLQFYGKQQIVAVKSCFAALMIEQKKLCPAIFERQKFEDTLISTSSKI